MTNNDILRRIRYTISKYELSAFFRKSGSRHYRNGKDQVLRKFLKGIQLKYCPRMYSPLSHHELEG